MMLTDINDAGRDTATACANYCGPGTQKIEIKLQVEVDV